ncbi:MAG: aminomethyl-transferring glycine dehydrogenase subunit GcvPA [Erysipelotrichaceae bacterium]|nr:aminomethyl-transferring glycine dehydrogenase subunit GcvPA [Erysipelotrichaceae bacterium]
MGRYVVSNRNEQQEMLKTLNMSQLDDLYADVPRSVLNPDLKLDKGVSEMEAGRIMEQTADKNVRFRSVFRGAGSYRHYIPAIVKSVTGKEEFVTAYTPYQAEISQGILQSIFEYQTMMCELTGLDVSNASVYDGAVGCAEALFMTLERNRNTVLVSELINPQYLEVIRTYCESRSVEVVIVKAKDGKTDIEDLKSKLSDNTASLLVQSPNYYGIIEDVKAMADLVHEKKARLIYNTNPIALGLLSSARDVDADICVMEGQPLGMPVSFGGPYLGIMTCKKEMMRRLPGRIVGQTVDHDGRRTYVLTLQAREQHIRREKASSNICSNEALCAMTAAVYLAAVGYEGLRQAAENSAAHAHYLCQKLSELGFRLCYDQPFFHEFLVESPIDPDVIEKHLAENGVLSGLKVGEKGILFCTTEMNTVNDIDNLVELIKEVL